MTNIICQKRGGTYTWHYIKQMTVTARIYNSILFLIIVMATKYDKEVPTVLILKPYMRVNV
jgi:hypothetical protein